TTVCPARTKWSMKRRLISWVSTVALSWGFQMERGRARHGERKALDPTARPARSGRRGLRRGDHPRQRLPGADLDQLGQLVLSFPHPRAHAAPKLAERQRQLVQPVTDLLTDAGRGEPLGHLSNSATDHDPGGHAETEPE